VRRHILHKNEEEKTQLFLKTFPWNEIASDCRCCCRKAVLVFLENHLSPQESRNLRGSSWYTIIGRGRWDRGKLESDGRESLCLPLLLSLDKVLCKFLSRSILLSLTTLSLLIYLYPTHIPTFHQHTQLSLCHIAQIFLPQTTGFLGRLFFEVEVALK
jgi:hypothetical protein